MVRRYLKVKSVEVSYLEKNTGGQKTVFFIHGNSGSGHLWAHQYQSKTFDQYRLIVFDLPGHGYSSAIPSKDYSVSNLANIMADAVSALANGNPYSLAGFSLGGNIVAEMLAHGTTPHGLVLLSSGLVGQEIALSDVIQNQLVVDVLFSENPSRDKVNEYFNGLPYAANPDLVTSLRSDYDKTTKEFRPTFLSTIEKGMYSDEIDLIRTWNGSPLLAYGRNDKIVNPSLLDRVSLPFWKGEIFKINNAAHLVNLDQPIVINQLMFDYFQDCL